MKKHGCLGDCCQNGEASFSCHYIETETDKNYNFHLHVKSCRFIFQVLCTLFYVQKLVTKFIFVINVRKSYKLY